MTRLLAPSEVFHAFLDWHTGFEVEIPTAVGLDAAAEGLSRLHAEFPRLGGRIVRTPDGFAFHAPDSDPTVATSAHGAHVAAALSAFEIDTARDGETRITGRLHHALCDVTGALSVIDHLLGLIGIAPEADSIATVAARDWPHTAEEILGGVQPDATIRTTRQFFSQAPSTPLKPAQPIHLSLDRALVRAIDDACAATSTALTGVIATALAPLIGTGDDVVVGTPVDCRVFADPQRTQTIPTRAIGNCSHGALVTVPRSARTGAAFIETAQAVDTELMDQLESEVPAAPFRDGRLYLPEHNAPAQLVVSNARGAARRFTRLAEAGTVLVLPESSIPALPMIAVNERPASGIIDISLIADPADYTPTEARHIVDTLAHTLTQFGEQQ
ncbi:hypothetical protein [Nocardia callitridis]|uniref:Acyltransferase PapA5 n=1 Tax=Nocardia callitridis TaxID=648753 RepID=A0ABP9K4H2_9NOCA